ncbi:MAG: hypothetical protein OXG78_05510 [Chloroflexi bacterium]|nr:hypothetical protein [Chloroflexota bacterium]
MITKLALLFMPIAAATLVLLGLAWHSGEAMPIDYIVALQQQPDGAIYGSRIVHQLADYKLSGYYMRQPDILVLGSSLMGQIREDFFALDPNAFYNGSMPALELNGLTDFYDRMETKPGVLIVGIDLVWFNADYDGYRRAVVAPDHRTEYERIRMVIDHMIQRFMTGNLTLEQLMKRRDPVYGHFGLGFRAIEVGWGYRPDGSMQLGLTAASTDRQRELVQSDLATFMFEDERYLPGSNLDEPALETLDWWLQTLKDDGVTVVAVTTPYHFLIHQGMNQSGAFSYMSRAAARLKELISAHGFYYHYFDDMSKWGAQENEWFDGYHMSESSSLRMMQSLFQSHPDLFDAYVDHNLVQDLLANFENPMDVFHELPK